MSRKKILFNYPTLPLEGVTSPPRSVYPLRDVQTDDSGNIAQSPEEKILNYISFGSGSSGNSCYIGTRDCGLIIDAGVKHDHIEKTLASCGISMRSVKALLLTHDHSDHVRYSYSLLRNNRHIRLMCTPKVLNGVLRRHNISRMIRDYHFPIFKEIPFEVGPLAITAFDVPHDGTDNMGFSISLDGRNFVLATDMGEVSERAHHYISEADYLVIESNYDLRMLLNGRYPEHLKARIQTRYGHMDNTATADFLSKIITPRLKHIFLCHLSRDNNTPQIAHDTTYDALTRAGISVGSGQNTLDDRRKQVQLTILPRFEATHLYRFRPDLPQ